MNSTPPQATLLQSVCWLACCVCLAMPIVLLASMLWLCTTTWGSGDLQPIPWHAFQLAAAGTLCVVGFSAAVAIPIGIGTAIYVEEYLQPGFWRNMIRRHINSTLGVPHLLYGVAFLAIWQISKPAAAPGLWSASALLALLMMPLVVASTQHALRSVPNSIRLFSYTLGASRGQTVFRQVLPAALPSIFRGSMMACARAIGEAASLLAMLSWIRHSGKPVIALDRFSTLTTVLYGELDGATSPSPVIMACIMMLLLGVAFVLLPVIARASHEDQGHEAMIHYG